MTTIVRHLVNDIDSSSYTFATDRVETTILVAAQLMIMNVDFNNTYEINVEASTLSPDPTDTDTKDNKCWLVGWLVNDQLPLGRGPTRP